MRLDPTTATLARASCLVRVVPAKVERDLPRNLPIWDALCGASAPGSLFRSPTAKVPELAKRERSLANSSSVIDEVLYTYIVAIHCETKTVPERCLGFVPWTVIRGDLDQQRWLPFIIPTRSHDTNDGTVIDPKPLQ